jgi:hypothetical protein
MFKYRGFTQPIVDSTPVKWHDGIYCQRCIKSSRMLDAWFSTMQGLVNLIMTSGFSMQERGRVQARRGRYRTENRKEGQEEGGSCGTDKNVTSNEVSNCCSTNKGTS